jgi:hypothetical protein
LEGLSFLAGDAGEVFDSPRLGQLCVSRVKSFFFRRFFLASSPSASSSPSVAASLSAAAPTTGGEAGVDEGEGEGEETEGAGRGEEEGANSLRADPHAFVTLTGEGKAVAEGEAAGEAAEEGEGCAALRPSSEAGESAGSQEGSDLAPLAFTTSEKTFLASPAATKGLESCCWGLGMAGESASAAAGDEADEEEVASAAVELIPFSSFYHSLVAFR